MSSCSNELRRLSLLLKHPLIQGETLDPNPHQQIVDVKAVTLHHFQLEQTGEVWTATVILDI
ncbi:MAG: hypothetical protein BRC42_16445 [Cyanobacteria bacterium QS_1_48_34]|nr:MAG: hypothetical protein BRC42_16445 [Cyanobacteria bacterium QS_1_48_34]PSO87069.1 MAG: hypothetical protein BRC45_02140 [Cyanobacteria bacterium QS_5_48_63]